MFRHESVIVGEREMRSNLVCTKVRYAPGDRGGCRLC